MATHTNRRSFIGGVAAGGAALQMRYAGAAEPGADAGYRGTEDLYRAKWSWDRVARGTHGTNCAGTCAFNVYIKNGVVWLDDSLLPSLQRGEPDIYVNPDDARERGVADGDLIRIFNPLGEFFALGHLSAGIQPGMLFMYHGWDPMVFRNRQNFGPIISTAGLIKPTTMAGDYGHLGYQPLAFAQNQIDKGFTCDFEKADPESVEVMNA